MVCFASVWYTIVLPAIFMSHAEWKYHWIEEDLFFFLGIIPSILGLLIVVVMTCSYVSRNKCDIMKFLPVFSKLTVTLFVMGLFAPIAVFLVREQKTSACPAKKIEQTDEERKSATIPDLPEMLDAAFDVFVENRTEENWHKFMLAFMYDLQGYKNCLVTAAPDKSIGILNAKGIADIGAIKSHEDGRSYAIICTSKKHVVAGGKIGIALRLDKVFCAISDSPDKCGIVVNPWTKNGIFIRREFIDNLTKFCEDNLRRKEDDGEKIIIPRM